MWGLQLTVGLGLVALGIWARRRDRGTPESSLWWVPIFLGLTSLSVSAVQRLLPAREAQALLGAFIAIGLLLLYMSVRVWRQR
jgi:hypothetical protein